MYSKHYSMKTIPAEFLLLVSPNALQHLHVSLEKKALDCNCSFALVSMKMDFQM